MPWFYPIEDHPPSGADLSLLRSLTSVWPKHPYQASDLSDPPLSSDPPMPKKPPKIHQKCPKMPKEPTFDPKIPPPPQNLAVFTKSYNYKF